MTFTSNPVSDLLDQYIMNMILRPIIYKNVQFLYLKNICITYTSEKRMSDFPVCYTLLLQVTIIGSKLLSAKRGSNEIWKYRSLDPKSVTLYLH